MDAAELNRIDNELAAEESSLEERLRAIRAARLALLQLNRLVNPEQNERDQEPSPTSASDAVLAVMLTAPDQIWRAADIEAAIGERGWLTDSRDRIGAVRGAISRLKRRGEIAHAPNVHGGYLLGAEHLTQERADDPDQATSRMFDLVAEIQGAPS